MKNNENSHYWSLGTFSLSSQVTLYLRPLTIPITVIEAKISRESIPVMPAVLGLNSYNWIIVPFTSFSTCVHWVLSTTGIPERAREVTVKVLSLTLFKGTVLLTPDKVLSFRLFSYFTAALTSVMLFSIPPVSVSSLEDCPRHRLPLESSKLTLSDDNLTALFSGMDT